MVTQSQLDHVIEKIIKKFPQLITIIANVEFIVNKNSSDISGKLYVTGKDIDEAKLVIEVNFSPEALHKAKVKRSLNEVLEHILIHELFHVVDRHYLLKDLHKYYETVDNQLVTIAAEYVVAKLLNHYVYPNLDDELFDYEKSFIQIAETLAPELKTYEIDNITFFTVYEKLLEAKNKLRQKMPSHCSISDIINNNNNSNNQQNQNNSSGNSSNKQQSKSNKQNKSNSNQNNSKNNPSNLLNNNQGNNNSNNNNSNKQQNNSSSSNSDNNNDNNSDGNEQIQQDNTDGNSNNKQEVNKASEESDKSSNSKPAGSNSGKDNIKTIKIPNSKELINETIKNRKLLLNQLTIMDLFKVERKVIDPIADLKAKLIEELRMKNTYDYYLHDYVTKPDFTYFVPTLRTNVKNDDYILIVDVSGSMASYAIEFIKFALQLHKRIRKIYVHDVKIVQEIDTRKNRLKDNLDINLTGGGTSFAEVYLKIINSNETRYKIIHVTDLYTDYEDFHMIQKFKEINYFVLDNEYDKNAEDYLKSLKLNNYKIIQYTIEKLKEVA